MTRRSLLRLLVLMSLVLGMLAPAEMRPVLADVTWSAYNDCSGTTGGNTTAYTPVSSGGSTSGLLKNYATGANTSVTATFTVSGSPTLNTSYGAMPTNTSSDAYTTFNGYVNMTGVVNYGSSGGWYIDLTFTGLDSTKQYTFVTTANRDDDTYTTRVTQFTLNDADAATNASSSGVTVVDNLNVAFCTGYNTLNGYVAKWTGISPGADQDFSVHFTFYGSEYRAYGPSGFLLQEEVSGPTILTSGTLNTFNSVAGTPSAEQSYSVSGLYLTNNIVITPPTDFELSLTSGTGFSSTPISLTPDGNGTVPATTIYVRLNPPTATTYSGNITHVSSPATTKNVAVTGSAVPTITTSGTLSAFSSAPGVISAEQSYTVSGVNLTANIAIAAPADFEISTTSGSGFGSSLSLSPTNGVVGNTLIYVRFNRATEGTSSGNITHTSTGATQKDVAVSGSASYCVTRTISQSSDDAYQSGTAMTINSTTLQTYVSSTRRYWGLRFQNITVPKNATITSASVTFRAAAAGTGTPTMSLWGEASDNAGTFTTVASNISNRTATSTVAWSMTAWTSGQDYASASLVTPVQEIVNRSGWASGNALVIMGQMTATSPSNRTAVAWDDTTQANEAALTICYTPPVYYTLTANNDGHGSVTLNPPGGSYASGTVVTLTPVPDTGYAFGYWLGANAGELTNNGDGTWSITMNENKSVTANFVVAYTLSATTDGHGTVTLSPPGGSYAVGTTVTLTPVPNPGYGFTGWVGAYADEVSGSGPSYTIVVNANKAVVANFCPLTSCSTANLAVAADTHMRSGTSRGSFNYGGAFAVELRTYYEQGTNDGQLGGALLLWDVSSIPAGAGISSASVTFYVTDTSVYDLNLYNMRRSWTEGSNNGAAGSGASWNYYGAGSGSWGTAGAQNTTLDRYNTNLWDATTADFDDLGSKTIALNASGVGVVQGWVAGTLDNYGLTIQNYDGTTIDLWGFASRENTLGYAPATLNVTYCTGGPANSAPAQPVLVSPADGATGVSTSPTLEVTVSDTDGNAIDVRFYGRAVGTGDWNYLGAVYAVAGAANATLVWPGLAQSSQYQWYVDVDDGPATTSSPIWSFTTVGLTTGTIIVEKQTTPDGMTTLFTFTGDAAGSIADGGQIVVSGLQPGAYHAQETVPASWTLTQIVCDDTNSAGDLPNREADFQVEAGETVKCTFYNVLSLDYGDAPNWLQTLLAYDGARHVIVAGRSLGPNVDAEVDGQPSALADADDLNEFPNPDDEDGVTLPPYLTPGDPAAQVIVDGGPSGGMLDAWIDFDGNGMFDLPAEHLWGGVSQVLVPGPQPLTFAVPAGANPSKTYARFRLSSAGNLLPFGLAPDGEVEDYMIYGQLSPLDYGDAPDSYKTLLASDGPRHIIIGGLFMMSIDAEADGQPSLLADADDLDLNVDDEDGVTLPAVLVAGNPAAGITVDGGLFSGMLDAWIDFNGNGAFDHPAEHLWGGFSQYVAQGSNSLTFAVPANAVNGPTYARFRFSAHGGLAPSGLASNGEVEDYRVVIEGEVRDLDYGDAPDSYQTLLTNNGARHAPGSGRLGPVVDVEGDGNPSALADGDDLQIFDDEDGVTLPAVLVPGDAAAMVTVDGGPSGGALDAWVDFNGNGAFDHPAEHLWLGASQGVVPGPQMITFAVPADAVPGPTYARFRLSMAGGLLPFGFAPDGEVEDYRVQIQLFTLDYAPGAGGTLTGSTHQTVAFGGSGTAVTAVADYAYEFANWSDGRTDNPRTDTNVMANVNVTANFNPTCYALTLGHSGNGTDPVASPASSLVCPTGQYVYGEPINLSGATPDLGWHIAGWYGTSADGSTASTNSLVMPASAHAAGVDYVPTCYILTLGHSGNGTTPTASPTNSLVCPTGQYVYGEPINLSGATPDLGSGIASWYGTNNDASTANTNSVTMPASALAAGVNYLRLLGDVNLDGLVNSTDALIVLTVDAGLPAGAFCPMNYGDVNLDGYVNSTDALIILTYDVGLPVGTFPVGQPVTEPVLITQPPGCVI